MITLTIRRLDPDTHARLRMRAAERGTSVEAEVRAILDAAVQRPEANILLAMHREFTEVGGVELDVEFVVPERVDGPREVHLP